MTKYKHIVWLLLLASMFISAEGFARDGAIDTSDRSAALATVAAGLAPAADGFVAAAWVRDNGRGSDLHSYDYDRAQGVTFGFDRRHELEMAAQAVQS